MFPSFDYGTPHYASLSLQIYIGSCLPVGIIQPNQLWGPCLTIHSCNNSTNNNDKFQRDSQDIPITNSSSNCLDRKYPYTNIDTQQEGTESCTRMQFLKTALIPDEKWVNRNSKHPVLPNSMIQENLQDRTKHI